MKHYRNMDIFHPTGYLWHDVIWRERIKFPRSSRKRTGLEPQEIGKGIKEW